MALRTVTPWTPYGLREDPFFQAELAPEPGARYPISLFVGRDADVGLLARQVLGAGSSRAVVEGEPGVGKTSFVNRLKATLAEDGVLTHAQPVRMLPNMTPQELASEFLRTVLHIHEATVTDPSVSEKPSGTRGNKRAKATGRVTPPATETTFWRKIARMLEGEDTVSGGVSVAGYGISAAAGRIPAEARGRSWYAELTRAVEYLTASTTGVLIHINNLENLSASDTRAAAQLMQSLRDYFLIPGSHWVFAGATGIDATIFRTSTQLGGIIPTTVVLEPLTGEEVGELLERRYRYLRRGVKYTPPVAVDEAQRLYERYDGDLRNFLRLLSGAVQRSVTGGEPAPLTAAQVLHVARPVYAARLREIVGPVDFDHMVTITRGQGAHVEVRVADVCTRTQLTQSAASALVRRLVQKQALIVSRHVARNVYYRLSGDVTVALGLL